jgi:hypothetical protein
VSVGLTAVSATSLPAGAAPTVTNTGTSTAATLVFGIPAGAAGSIGPQGGAGLQGPPGAGQTDHVTNHAAVRAYTGTLASLVVDGHTNAGDGGGGTFVWNAASMATDDDGIVLQQTGLTTGRWLRLIDGHYLSVKWYGARGDGSTDDAPAINAAIAAATTSTYYDTLEVLFPSSSQCYLVKSTISLNPFTRIYSPGATLLASSSFTPGSPILQLGAEDGLHGNQTCVIRGLTVNGGTIGTTQGSATVIGIEATEGSAVILDNVVANNCSIGFVINGLQFCTFRNCKSYNCSVGFFCLPQVSANSGGDNSDSFYDLQAARCIVGFLFALPPPDSHIDGVGNVMLYNPSMEENACCAMAFIGQSPAATGQATNWPQGNILNIDIISGACETTTQITNISNYSFTYAGNTYGVPQVASVYMSYANVTMQSWTCPEASPNFPSTSAAVQLFNNSSLLLKNCGLSPSIPSGIFISADPTSKVMIEGSFFSQGPSLIYGIASNSASLTSYSLTMFVGTTNKFPSNIPNNTLNPAYGDGTTATYPATGAVSVDAFGNASYQATLMAAAGSVYSNCLYLANQPTTAAIGIIAYDIVSSVDRVVTCGWLINQANRDLKLTANITVRVCHVFPNFIANSTDYAIVPRAGTAGTLSVSNVHTYYSATDDLFSRGIINQILRGAFNNKMSLTGYGDPTALGMVGPNGAFYMNQSGGVGSTMFVYNAGTTRWNAVAGV